MWKRWLSLLDGAGAASAHPPRDVAMAVLLLECARADFEHDEVEVEAIRAALAAQLSLGGAELEQLIGEAGRVSAEAVSLHGPISRLNAELGPDDKHEMMAWLWRVACADGRIDPHEEQLLRRVADLLHVPHAVFIRAKLAAQDGA